MEKFNKGGCEDRIEVDQLLEEMTTESLEALRNIIDMCHDCDGCSVMLADIKKELEIRKTKNKNG